MDIYENPSDATGWVMARVIFSKAHHRNEAANPARIPADSRRDSCLDPLGERPGRQVAVDKEDFEARLSKAEKPLRLCMSSHM
jgi:hypothetical protein